MNKISTTYRLFALMMAFLVFTTSVGFSIDMHYCQDHLRSSSLFGKAPTCYEMAGMKKPVKTCELDNKTHKHQHKGVSIDEKECCHNESIHFQSTTTQQVNTASSVTIQQLQQFVAAYFTAFFTSKYEPEGDANSFTNYNPPPLIQRDIYVLTEAYLL